tara:strand:+ start:27 stop:305 length:279 start_codon:yes stop_codon:yes gene_type:complete
MAKCKEGQVWNQKLGTCVTKADTSQQNFERAKEEYGKIKKMKEGGKTHLESGLPIDEAVARFRDTTDKAWKATKNPKRGKRKPYWTKDWNRP